MGLLDSLSPGLLELLQNSARNQNFNAGIGADDASYARAPGLVPQMPPPVIMAQQDQPSPLDSAPWPAGPVGAPSRGQPIAAANQPSPLDQAQWPAGPIGAPSNANASMPQQGASPAPMSLAPPAPATAAAQSPAAASSPGIGDRLASGFKGFAANMAGGPIGALMGGIAGVAGLNEGGNATEQALLAKGVDPLTVKAARQNPELMKTLVAQHFGPQTKTPIGDGYVLDKNGNVSRAYTPDKTPTSMGEGYFYNPATHKIERAYTPEDKTPPGFERVGDGLRALPNGPADLNYIRQKTEAEAANGTSNVQAAVEQRRRAAAQIGLEPTNPAYQSYILTGKMPREDAQPLTATDKKTIIEADEHVQATQTGIDNLRQAKVLSKKAYEGPGAGMRGYATSLVGAEGGVATSDLNNLITTNALQQLKTTFGGNPTEGERAILLDVQGSASQPDVVRQKIYDRAIAAMEKRQEFNRQRADALRGGTYYKPPKGAPGATPAPAAGAHPDPLGIL